MKKKIKKWQHFAKYFRQNQANLIDNLPDYKDPILVSGCQRSGTTIIANVILNHTEVLDYRRGGDSELEGALILSGHTKFEAGKRVCFQTTYLNERVQEYFKYKGLFKLVFVIRNPYSVVYSMCYHWKRKIELRNFALNELFQYCGAQLLTERETKKYNFFGSFAISPLRKASLSYVAKTSQVFELKEQLGNDCIVIDYDDIINKKKIVLPYLFDFLILPYSPKLLELIHTKSVNKAENLTTKEKVSIRKTCGKTYEDVRKLAASF